MFRLIAFFLTIVLRMLLWVAKKFSWLLGPIKIPIFLAIYLLLFLIRILGGKFPMAEVKEILR